MQKSLTAFAEKSPALANKLGIMPSAANHRGAHSTAPKYKEDSGSESDDEPLRPPKYFKNREKEREVKRQKGELIDVSSLPQIAL